MVVGEYRETLSGGRETMTGSGGAPSRVPRRKSQVTKERIALVALDLFNRHGYNPITTNKISQACDISPGNLYYHFRNREDILWFLFEGVEAQVRSYFIAPSFPEHGLDLIRQQIGSVIDILFEYRFFFPDQTAILRRDERVMDAFRVLQRDVIEAMAAELAAITARSPVPPPDPVVLARSMWLVVTGWITFLAAQGREIDRPAVAEVVEMALALVQPFIGVEG